jgi:hypothetical protein
MSSYGRPSVVGPLSGCERAAAAAFCAASTVLSSTLLAIYDTSRRDLSVAPDRRVCRYSHLEKLLILCLHRPLLGFNLARN